MGTTALGGDIVAPGGIDWGVSLGEPYGDSLGDLVGGNDPQMDADGTGPVIDPIAAAMDTSDAALLGEPAEPVAQLASTGGRWRSRSAG